MVAHPSRSQILVEVRGHGNTLEKALDVLTEVGVTPIQHQEVRSGDPACILMLLPNEDMKEAVLKLWEAGFSKVKGINAKSHFPGKGLNFQISPPDL
jgi:hypothetical protein